MRIDQFVNSFSDYDAVGNHIRLLRHTLLGHASESEVFAEQNLSKKKLIFTLEDYLKFDSPHNIIIYHHSIGTSIPLFLSRVKAYKILIYHNVTPSSYFSGIGGEPTFENACEEGIRQLAYLRIYCDEFWTVSPYNREELLAASFPEVDVFPLLRDYEKLVQRKENLVLAQSMQKSKNLVFVGRLTPHKNQIEILHLFLSVRKQFGKKLRLILVGSRLPVFYDYILNEAKQAGLRVSESIEQMDEVDLVLAEGISDGDLACIYRNTELFVSLSKHEGLCVPVIEAAHCGLATVSLNTDGLADTVKACQGRVFSNPKEMTEAIIKILSGELDLGVDVEEIKKKFSLAEARFLYEKKIIQLQELSHRR